MRQFAYRRGQDGMLRAPSNEPAGLILERTGRGPWYHRLWRWITAPMHWPTVIKVLLWFPTFTWVLGIVWFAPMLDRGTTWERIVIASGWPHAFYEASKEY